MSHSNVGYRDIKVTSIVNGYIYIQIKVLFNDCEHFGTWYIWGGIWTKKDHKERKNPSINTLIIIKRKDRKDSYSVHDHCPWSKSLETWRRETGQVWPKSKFRWISSNTDPLRVRWSWAIQNEQLMPSWRRDTAVRWRGDCASRTTARERWEDGPSSHTVPMGTRSSYNFFSWLERPRRA